VHTRPAVVEVTHDRFLGHAEPDVAINPTNAKNLLGACQFVVAQRIRLPGSFASFDGGRSWHDDGLLPLPHGYEQGADTTVAFDGRGNGFIVALMAHGGGGYPSRVRRGGIFLWKTTNGGRSFSKPRPVYVGRGFQDHPWLGVRRVGQRTLLFIAWTNNAGLEFTASTNDGSSFSTPRLLVRGSAPSNPVLTVGANKLLQVFFEEFAGDAVRLSVVTSVDDGARFRRPTTIGRVMSPPKSGSGPKGGAQPPPLLAAATDASGTTSAVAVSAQDPQAGHPVIDLWLNSRANGRWHGPLRPLAGGDAALTQTQPRLLLMQGRLYLSYFTLSREGEITQHLAYGAPSRGTLSSQKLGGGSFKAAGFIGDYQALAVAGSTGFALWNDGRSGRLEIVSGRFNPRD
jgi:hypothetical protein